MSKDIFKKARSKPKKPWYMVNTKNYQFPFWVTPLVPFVIGLSKLNDWLYDNIKWSEGKATKLLSHVLPKVVDYDKDENAYYYCMAWGTNMLWHKAPLRYKRFAKKYHQNLRSFIKEKYMAKGYVKSVINNGYEEWVEFKPIGFKEG